jgi:hypothetical protein
MIRVERFVFFRAYLSQKNVIEKLEEGVASGRHAIMLENTFHLLSYVRANFCRHFTGQGSHSECKEPEKQDTSIPKMQIITATPKGSSGWLYFT